MRSAADIQQDITDVRAAWKAALKAEQYDHRGVMVRRSQSASLKSQLDELVIELEKATGGNAPAFNTGLPARD